MDMSRLERIVARLPEATRVDIEEWGGHPTFRVRGKNFVFSDQTAEHLSLKLPLAEAEAVVATDDDVSPAGYGLGRHGWIALTVRRLLVAQVPVPGRPADIRQADRLVVGMLRGQRRDVDRVARPAARLGEQFLI